METNLSTLGQLYYLLLFLYSVLFVLFWVYFYRKIINFDLVIFSILIAWCFIILYFIDGGKLFQKGKVVKGFIENANLTGIISYFLKLPMFIIGVVLVTLSLLYYSFPQKRKVFNFSTNLSYNAFKKYSILIIFILTFSVIYFSFLSPVVDTGYCSAQGGYNLLNSLPLYSAEPSYSCWKHVYGIVTYISTIPAHIVGYFLDYPVLTEKTLVTPHLHPLHERMVFSAKITSIFALMASVFGLYKIGKDKGIKGHIILCTLWLSFPLIVTIFVFSFNDIIMYMFLILSLAYIEFPLICGILLGLSVQAKFLTLILTPLFFVYYSIKKRYAFLYGFLLANFLSLLIIFIRGEMKDFFYVAILDAGERGIFFSLWGLVKLPIIRQILFYIIMFCSIVPVVYFWRKRMHFFQLLRYGSAITSLFLLTTVCLHPGIVALPVTLVLIKISLFSSREKIERP